MAECIMVHKMFVIYALSILYDLQSSAVSVFSKEFLEDHDILFHTQCPYALDSIPLLQFGLQVTYYHFQVETILYNPFMQKGIRNFKQPTIVLICPVDVSELVLYLEAIASVSVSKTVSQQPMFVLQWPEPNSTCLSALEKGFPSNLQDNAILQTIVKRYPMDSDIYLNFNCENFLRNNSETIFSKHILLELYSVHKALPIIQPLLMKCSKHGFTSEDVVNKIKRRSNFHGVSVRGAYFADPTLNSKTNYGVMLEFMQFVSANMNFTLSKVKGTGWIGESSNGSKSDNYALTGMGEQILSGQIDIITQNSELVPYRMKYLKPFQPMYYFRLSALFRQPPASLFRNIYIKSFSASLWTVILFSWFSILCCKKVMMYLTKVFRIRVNFDEAMENDDHNSSAVLWLTSSITMQGWHNAPTFQSPSLKIMHISILIFSLVCYTVYAGSIISTLSHQKGPILNYEQLVKSSLSFVADNYIVNAVNALEGLFERQNWSKKEFVNRIISPIDGYNMIKNSSYVLLTHKDGWFQRIGKTSPTPITVQEICESFTEFPLHVGMPSYTGVMIRRNSSLREYLNYPFVAQFQSGLKCKYVKNYVTANSPRCLSHDKPPARFGINDVLFVYIILAIGSVFSLTFLVIENLRYKYFSNCDEQLCRWYCKRNI